MSNIAKEKFESIEIGQTIYLHIKRPFGFRAVPATVVEKGYNQYFRECILKVELQVAVGKHFKGESWITKRTQDFSLTQEEALQVIDGWATKSRLDAGKAYERKVECAKEARSQRLKKIQDEIAETREWLKELD